VRVKAGEESVPPPRPAKYAGGPKIADLAERYLVEYVAVRCKPKTQRTARTVVHRHIVSALGPLPIAAVERSHVMALHESLCETSAMTNMVPEDHDEPCHSIPMKPRRKRERLLTDADLTRLGQVLDDVSGNGSQVSAGARLMLACTVSVYAGLNATAPSIHRARDSKRQPKTFDNL